QGQRLMQREFGGEVADRLAAEVAELVRPPGVVGGARGIEGGERRLVQLQEAGIVRNGFEFGLRDQPQHAYGVVRGGPPQRVIEAAKYAPAFDVPAPPQVGREFSEA